METLLAADNTTIVLLVALYIEQKRVNAALQKQVERQWELLGRFRDTLRRMRDLLAMDADITGQFHREQLSKD